MYKPTANTTKKSCQNQGGHFASMQWQLQLAIGWKKYNFIFWDCKGI
jgi:hypothetical protein